MKNLLNKILSIIPLPGFLGLHALFIIIALIVGFVFNSPLAGFITLLVFAGGFIVAVWIKEIIWIIKKKKR